MIATQAVQLNPLSDSEYAEFAALQVVEYAHQLVSAGEVAAENGIATAQERLAALLTDRLRVAGHTFFVASSAPAGVRVGWVWLSPAPEFLGPGHESTRWLSQVTVEEAHRRRGWGRSILVAMERHLAAAGVEQIWLRVFNWNVVARALYESQGYELATQFATDAHLCKRLSRTGPAES
jgi:ribosomal protein S18 acetylase RimI-like enzyme